VIGTIMGMRYVHTNLIARNWRTLATFYQEVFNCVPVPPQRNLHGKWLDRATGRDNARISGAHLLLPGNGKSGPTLEIFEYDGNRASLTKEVNTPGFAHIAFAVDDVQEVLQRVLARGGSELGDVTTTVIAGAGTITVVYVRDPEGNIIELQRWHGSGEDRG
jgi:predicted enzyme related to lactoylglutathione lyase